MKTIDRFVIKSYLGPMVLTFFIVMFILMMNFVWRYIDELVGKGLDARVIIELLLYAAATMIPLGVPLATLLAGIMTMGNLGENYELLAMKSCGMSLPRIFRPLIIVVVIIAIGSFFAANNLVPYSWKKMSAIIYDIRNQKQVIEFEDGVFFNGIEDMSIRVERQDPKTHLLTNVLIYDTRNRNGNMITTIADSGFIRLSDDKKYLLVTLFNGEMYETTRSNRWYDESTLNHRMFARQDAVIPMEGFDFQRSDSDIFSNSNTKTMAQLDRDIDSLQVEVVTARVRSSEPLLKALLPRDNSLMGVADSTKVDYSYKRQVQLLDSISRMDVRKMKDLVATARGSAWSSRSSITYEEDSAKSILNRLYRDEVEWHRKVSLPFSIIIFFLIGAPLGAIIRRGGLGMPAVISVLFFVIYYIISITGEKLAKDGAWTSFEGMWLSSFILAPIAIYLTYKATNDSNLLNMEWYRAVYDKMKIRIKDKKENYRKNVSKKRA